MDFNLPADLVDYLARIDAFIEAEIKPLQAQDDNERFFDHRREWARTDFDKGGLPLTSRGDAAAPLRVVVGSESSVLRSPALWVPLGVAVVGGAIATAFLLTRSKGTSTVTVGVRE